MKTTHKILLFLEWIGLFLEWIGWLFTRKETENKFNPKA